ncbi:hypothetical protein SAMN05216188_114156 [Lentzea xinjiangensis]|uniref:ParB-like N-terminal domain-containing protein n=1 Tax=Lentzea xinjiangensis TaxID=402600 RepID=A0A1H9RHP6_9PSEU|nr:hypothetical protein [Lentzea xinjiangensis]SER72232.1 hypothetical protein SAMN05216188_114156 [Lentzea xinjiangensis]
MSGNVVPLAGGRQRVGIASLVLSGSPRRSGVDEEHVRTLASTDDPLPAITVHRSTMRVLDGAHRVHAALLRGETHIDVVFYDGNEADAFVLAVKSNVRHGLPLSAEDRIRAAERIIASHPDWSDRGIASVSGLAAKTVAAVRQRVSPEGRRSRTGRDGKVRPINSADGRRRASRLISENPGMSLREIAESAGIAPATARDVRERMRAGEDPVPPQQRRRAAVPPVTPPDLRSLRRDPSLRFSEAGRVILRLMDTHTITADGWQQLADSVPSHCADAVADLARLSAEALQGFAHQVRRRKSR